MTSLDRAKDLLRQMTLTEKVGQLVLRAGCKLDEQGKLSEISRLSGGVEKSEQSEMHAKELISFFDELKR